MSESLGKPASKPFNRINFLLIPLVAAVTLAGQALYENTLGKTPVAQDIGAQVGTIPAGQALVAPEPPATFGDLANIEHKLRGALQRINAEIELVSVAESPVRGIYEANITGGKAFYFTPDARFLFSGELFEVGEAGMVNHTELKRQAFASKLIEEQPVSEMISYTPENVRATITVFTDVDCPYCQRLHKDIPALNEQGIEVRYLAFPRMGLGSDSYQRMVSAWCAEDQNAALNALMAGNPIEQKACDNPVARQFMLGEQFGVNGTPTIILPSGIIQPGYSSVSDLMAALNKTLKATDVEPQAPVAGKEQSPLGGNEVKTDQAQTVGATIPQVAEQPASSLTQGGNTSTLAVDAVVEQAPSEPAAAPSPQSVGAGIPAAETNADQAPASNAHVTQAAEQPAVQSIQTESDPAVESKFESVSASDAQATQANPQPAPPSPQSENAGDPAWLQADEQSATQ